MFAKWRRRAPIDDEERAPLLSAAAAVPSQLAAARPQDDDLLLRLGSAFGAIQAGKLPSTDQTCHALQSLLDSSLLQVDAPAVVEPSRLSTAGRQVVEDIRTLLEAVIVALKAKNGHDELQELWWNTRHAKPAVKPTVDLPDAPSAPSITVDEVQGDAAAFLYSLQTLTKLLLGNILATSTGILDDVVYLIRSILADSAAELSERTDHAAEALRPPERHHGVEEKQVDAKDVERQADSLKATLADGGSALGEAGGQTQGLREKLSQTTQADTREVALQRIQQLITRIRADPASRDAVLTILAIAERYLAEVENTSDAVNEAIEQTEVGAEVEDPGQHATLALKSLRALIESLSERNLGGAFSAAKACATDAQNNDAIASYIHDLHAFSRSLLSSEKTPAADETFEEIGKLYDRGRELLTSDPDWKRDANKLSGELEAVYTGAKEDKTMHEVGAAATKLLVDLGALGKRGFWTLEGEVGDLWRDLANVILPRLLHYLKHLSVPRTEVVTEYADVVVDDLRLVDLVLLPTFIRLTQRTDFVFDRPPSQTGTLGLDHATGTLTLHGLSFNCVGVSLAFARKFLTWLPYMRRFSSLAEVSLPLPGLSISLTYTRTEPSESSWVRFDSIDASFPTLAVRMHKSSHPVVTWALGRLASPIIRTVLSRVLQDQLRTLLEHTDRRAFALADEAKTEGGDWTAWLRAFIKLAPTSEDLSTGGRAAFDSGGSLLSNVKATTVGVIKDDPAEGYAVAIGAAPQLVEAEVAGPGYDSMRELTDDAREATPVVPPVGKAVERVQEGVEEVQGAAGKEARRIKAKPTWRSEAFSVKR